MLLAGSTPLLTVAADNPRVAEYLCPATNEAVDPARLRLPESMAAPAQQALAGELAYFRAEHGRLGVFAPRGWSCRSWTGSSGNLLLVTPRPLPPPYFPLPAISGPAVMMQTTDGTDVGRFHLALIAERLFPLLGHDIIDRVRQEHLIADDSFDTEPYPDDHVEDLSDRVVEYSTAGGHTGLGTDSLLEPNDQAIRGLTVLNPEALTDALTEFRIRLTVPLAPVEEAIVELETRCLQVPRGCRELGD
jgi:hypothetical protein